MSNMTLRHRRRTSLGADAQDVHALAEAVVRRAGEDVELALRFLELAGVIPPERARAKRAVGVPLDVMLKAAALMRVLRWQRPSGVDRAIKSFPTPKELLDDLGKLPAHQRFDAQQIARDVFSLWFANMSWSLLAVGADVTISDMQPPSVVDELARLLWQFRHLVDNSNNNRKEE